MIWHNIKVVRDIVLLLMTTSVEPLSNLLLTWSLRKLQYEGLINESSLSGPIGSKREAFTPPHE
jgi:hypothetical protein